MIESDEEWNGEDWISFGFAAEQIKRALNTSLGQASVQLRELCASGPVRAIGYDMRSNMPMGPIEPMEWPLPGHMYVAVSTDDLAYWLDKQAEPKPAQGAFG